MELKKRKTENAFGQQSKKTNLEIRNWKSQITTWKHEK